jgi:hypothetical protein
MISDSASVSTLQSCPAMSIAVDITAIPRDSAGSYSVPTAGPAATASRSSTDRGRDSRSPRARCRPRSSGCPSSWLRPRRTGRVIRLEQVALVGRAGDRVQRRLIGRGHVVIGVCRPSVALGVGGARLTHPWLNLRAREERPAVRVVSDRRRRGCTVRQRGFHAVRSVHQSVEQSLELAVRTLGELARDLQPSRGGCRRRSGLTPLLLCTLSPASQ